MDATRSITVTVNDTRYERTVSVRTSLADFLRHDIGLTGTHVGCEHGVCGACTLLLDGEPVRSCLMLAVQADGHELTTVEGLAGSQDELHPIQQAFWENHGLQCGFCTPGMVMNAIDLARSQPNLTEADVRSGLDGNLCRCTGYHNIVKAVLAGAAGMRS